MLHMFMGAFFCSTEESASLRSVVLLVAEDYLRASLFSAIKLDGRESRIAGMLQGYKESIMQPKRQKCSFSHILCAESQLPFV
jgi:hypothetical protein